MASWATGQNRDRQPRVQAGLPVPVPKGHQEQFSSFSSQQGSQQACQLRANALRQHPEVQLSQFSPATGTQQASATPMNFPPHSNQGPRGQAQSRSAPAMVTAHPASYAVSSLPSHHGSQPRGADAVREGLAGCSPSTAAADPHKHRFAVEDPSQQHGADESFSRSNLQLVQAHSQLQAPFIWIF